MVKTQIAVFVLTLALVLGLAQVDRACGRMYGCGSVTERLGGAALTFAGGLVREAQETFLHEN